MADPALPLSAVTVASFQSGTDRLELDLTSQEATALRIGPSPDGANGLVQIGDATIAILQGAPLAKLADLQINVVSV